MFEPTRVGCFWPLNLPFLTIVYVFAALPLIAAEAPEDYFHLGATNYVFEQKQEAKKVVEAGLKKFPDDVPLQRLLELLKDQENQQQQQDDKDQKQDDKKDQQQKQQDQKDQQQKNDQKKDDESKKQEQKDSQDKKDADEKEKKESDKQQGQEPQDQGEKGDQKQAGKMRPMQMTPQQAAQLLDAHKGEERVLLFTPQLLRTNRQVNRTKDW